MPSWQVHFEARVDLGNPSLVKAVARVDALADLISGVPLPPDLRERFNRLNIMRAVRGTTGIEGTELSELEVSEVIAAGDAPVLGESRAREEAEVRNANRAMRFIVELVARDREHALVEDDIREIHRLTTEGIDYKANEPGRYRDHGVHAGDYVSPPGSEVPRLMAEFVEWFRDGPARDWPGVVRAIVAHFYVISIHPFGDGNGRTSRAVESLQLYRSGINVLGFYSLANYYYRKRPEYVEALDRARFAHNGELTELVLFALQGLILELEAVRDEVIRELKKIAFRDYARESLQFSGSLTSKVGERRLMLVLHAIDEPIPHFGLLRRTLPIAGLYGAGTSKMITRDLNALMRAGLIRIEDGLISANLGIMDQFVEREPE